MRAPIAPAALLLLLVPGMAPADTPKPILEPIVVTATRTARTADETLA